MKLSKSRNYILAILLIISIITAVIGSATASGRHERKPILFDTEKGVAEGIDVSSHNNKIDWELVAESTDFAIIRAGYRGYGAEGKLAKDKLFAENIKGAEKAGVPAGVYFYTQAITPEEAREEARLVLDMMKGHRVDLPVFIDFEYPYNEAGEPHGRLYEAKLSRQEATAVVNAFCNEIYSAGYHTGVYASSNVFTFHLDEGDIIDEAYIWVADYNKSVKFAGNYDIWQYTKNGECAGVNSKYCDVNRWYGE